MLPDCKSVRTAAHFFLFILVSPKTIANKIAYTIIFMQFLLDVICFMCNFVAQ